MRARPINGPSTRSAPAANAVRQDQDVIQAVAAKRPDQAFNIGGPSFRRSHRSAGIIVIHTPAVLDGADASMIFTARGNSNDNSAKRVNAAGPFVWSPAAVAPAGAYTGHRATERYLGLLSRAIAPLFSPTSIFSHHPELNSICVTRLAMRSRRVLSCGSRSLTSTNVSIRCTCSRISRRWLLIASPVAAARSAKLRSATLVRCPAKSFAIRNGLDALFHAANFCL